MSCSFVQMSSDEVKKLAEDCLARIEARNDRVVKAWINEERQNHEKSWWRRLFRLAVPTDDQLRKEFFDNWVFSMDVSMYAWRSRQVAENLLKASSRASTINVSAEDLDYIS